MIVIMIMMMVMGLIVSADVDHQSGGIVSHHVEELSLHLELVDLVLTVSPGHMEMTRSTFLTRATTSLFLLEFFSRENLFA